ncbi:MAG: 50S ribosomal protein L18 [Planctomycetota bacterium]|nr:MAG: 50S ribosomal protein L18 [Planctomycetota bacterium]
MRMKTVPKRRRRECKTDYLARLKMLKGGRPRLVFRKTNRYLIVQYIKSEEAKDKVVFGVTSKFLLKKGWPEEFRGSLKSIPAAYLMGYYVAKKIKRDRLENPILDVGMLRMIHKSRPYAFIKGLVDAGLDISCKEEAFPEKERIEGKSLKLDFSGKFKEIKSKLEENGSD